MCDASGMAKRSRKTEWLLGLAGSLSALVGVGGATLGCPGPVATKYGGPSAPPPDTNAPPAETAEPAPAPAPEPTVPAVKYGGPPAPAPAVKYGGPTMKH